MRAPLVLDDPDIARGCIPVVWRITTPMRSMGLHEHLSKRLRGVRLSMGSRKLVAGTRGQRHGRTM